MPFPRQHPLGQEFASHTQALFEHSCPGTQLFLQGTVCPQLFVPEPHDFPVHAMELSGAQHVSSDRQTPAFGHVAAHITL
jgi:hypothetical protein